MFVKVNNEGWLPIHYAASQGHLRSLIQILRISTVTKTLLEKTTQKSRFQPIHLAIKNGHYALTRYFATYIHAYSV